MKYTGELSASGLRSGQGTLVYGNGYFKYSGEWVNGKKHGIGILWLGNTIDDADDELGCQSYYHGNFVNDEIEGNGERVYEDGSKYEGEFHLGEKEGEGKQTFADGREYQGTWIQNRFHGQGQLLYSNGDKYFGNFFENKRSGKGTLTGLDGYEYNGEWQDGVQHGTGVAQYVDGSKYDGEWEFGKRNGSGVLVDNVSNIIYDGLWKDDLRVFKAGSCCTMDESRIPNDLAIFAAYPGQSVNTIFPLCVTTMENETRRILTEENGRKLILEYKDEESDTYCRLSEVKTVQGVANFPTDDNFPDSLRPKTILKVRVRDISDASEISGTLDDVSYEVKIESPPKM